MEQTQLNWIANFIWGIADDVLRDLYVRGKYRDVILPMTVLRRLDAVLEPTKKRVRTIRAKFQGTFGAKMPRADWQFVGEMAVTLPPLTEQAAIVRYLDHTDRRIRRYIRAKQKLVKLLNEQKQTIIHRAVRRGRWW